MYGPHKPLLTACEHDFGLKRQMCIVLWTGSCGEEKKKKKDLHKEVISRFDV